MDPTGVRMEMNLWQHHDWWIFSICVYIHMGKPGAHMTALYKRARVRNGCRLIVLWCIDHGCVCGDIVTQTWLELHILKWFDPWQPMHWEDTPINAYKCDSKITQETTASTCPPDRVKTGCLRVPRDVWKIMALVFPRVTIALHVEKIIWIKSHPQDWEREREIITKK